MSTRNILIGALVWAIVPNPVVTFFTQRILNRTLDELSYRRHALEMDPSAAFCIGRFNLTHQFGCQNSRSVQYGVPYVVSPSVNLSTILNEIDSMGSKRILLIDIFQFEWFAHFRANVLDLERTVAGAILFNTKNDEFPSPNATYKSYSHDSVCPGSTYGSSENASSLRQCQTKWVSSENTYLNFAHTKWPFPIFYVRNRTVIDELLGCVESNSGLFRLNDCMVRLKLNLNGAVNSKRCMERNTPLLDALMTRSTTHCSKISINNLHSPLLRVVANGTVANRSVIVLVARMDSLSAFESFAPGANSVYSGLIVFFTIVHLLKQHREQIESKNKNTDLSNILYSLFDGESFGNMGSTTSLYYANFHKNGTMKRNKFVDQFKLNKFALVLELNQLLTNDSKYWVHTGKHDNPKAADYVQKLIKHGNGGSIAIEKANSQELPPSTSRVFKALDVNISTLFVTGYDSQIADPYFHSFFDTFDPKQLDSSVNMLSKLAVHLAKYLYTLLTNEHAEMKNDKQFVRSLAICFFQLNSSCDLFNGKLVLKEIPFNFTTPVRSSSLPSTTMGQITKHNARTMRYAVVRDALAQVFSHANQHKSDCSLNPSNVSVVTVPPDVSLMKNDTNKTEADSQCTQLYIEAGDTPFFDYLQDDDQEPTQWLNANRHFEFSTMVESFYETYNQPSVILFKRPGMMYQIWVVSVGIIVLVLSFLIAHCMTAKSKVLFIDSKLVVIDQNKSQASSTPRTAAVPPYNKSKSASLTQ